jgi:zinc and cadmium transporter
MRADRGGSVVAVRLEVDTMPAPIGLIAAAIAADGLAALVGAFLPEASLRRHRAALLGFATGVLVGTTVLDLVPAALGETRPGTVLAVLVAGGSAMALLERGIGGLGRRPTSRVAWMLLGADALHNAADGAAIAAAFLISVPLGLATSLAVIAHELPEELADYLVLRGSAVGRRRALVAMMVVQLTAAIGAVLTLVLAGTWRRISGIALAVGAGTFLYIGLVDLAPVLFRGEGAGQGGVRRAWIGLAVGLVVAAVEAVL